MVLKWYSVCTCLYASSYWKLKTKISKILSCRNDSNEISTNCTLTLEMLPNCTVPYLHRIFCLTCQPFPESLCNTKLCLFLLFYGPHNGNGCSVLWMVVSMIVHFVTIIQWLQSLQWLRWQLGCGIYNRTPDLDGNTFSPLNSWYTYRAEVFERMYSVGPG